VVRPPSLATELVDGPCYKRIIVPLERLIRSLSRVSSGTHVLQLIEHAQVTLLRVVTPDKTAPGTEAGAAGASRRPAGLDEAERISAKVRVALAT
jgi:hypothetical protein